MGDLQQFLDWAAGVYRLNNSWRDLLRIQELKAELTNVASEISSATPNIPADQNAMLGYFSQAEAVLISLKGSIGGRFLFWTKRRALILEIEKVRVVLRRYQNKKSRLEKTPSLEAYRQISHVALRVEHHVQDRRLGR